MIGFLGFLVWAHHMFATPSPTIVLVFFMLGSFLIAVPTGVKMFNWVATLWRGTIEFKTPLLFAVGFLATFLIGGITGIFLAVFPVDWQLTDTYFVVAHLHYVLMGGAVFGIFAAIYYWFPKITGRMLSEGLGKTSFWLMLIGFHTTFLIQHSLGLDGMPRRIYEYADVGHLELYNLISTIGSFILATGILVTVLNVVKSVKRGVIAGPDPWRGNTLEWFTTSPPPVNNFDVVPRVRSVEPMKDIRRQIERQSAPVDDARRALHGVRGPRLMSTPRAAAVGAAPLAGARQVLSDYVELTKPRVQSLLLFTTVTTMLVAGHPSIELILLTCLGGYLSAGGAGAVNHYYDRDIDARMARTANRPVPSGRVAPRAALAFGLVLATLAVLELSIFVNPLAAALSFSGFLGYTLVYTLWLKRTTPQNIVIGGAAGAVPPLVGWAAVTGGLDGTALYLFAIVFFWTPPHFWALSLLMKDEYARVGVPMLPVVRGERETRRQILLYSVLLYAVTQLPFCASGFGTIYLVGSFLLGVAFIGGAALLLHARRPPQRAEALPVLAPLPGPAVRDDGRRRPPIGSAPDGPQPRPQEHPLRADHRRSSASSCSA